MEISKIFCVDCGKEIIPGNRPNGLPNGVGFETKEGKIINVCTDCLIAIGKKKKEEGSDGIRFI